MDSETHTEAASQSRLVSADWRRGSSFTCTLRAPNEALEVLGVRGDDLDGHIARVRAVCGCGESAAQGKAAFGVGVAYWLVRVEGELGGGSASDLKGCFKGLSPVQGAPKGLTRAEIGFADGMLPAAAETLEQGKTAAVRYTSFVRTLRKCSTVSFTANGIKISGTVGGLFHSHRR